MSILFYSIYGLILSNLKINLLNNHNRLNYLENKKVEFYTETWLSDMLSTNRMYYNYMYDDLINENINSQFTLCKMESYIGFTPFIDIYYNHPMYIGKLYYLSEQKILYLNSIIQNPYYLHIHSLTFDYINELKKLCDISNITLDIDNLKDYSSSRYWLSIRH